MNRLLRFATIGFMAMAACLSAYGQSSGSGRKVSAVSQTALYLLDDTLDEIREVEDIEVRVKLAEDVVELLAKKRPERCRQTLDALFDDVLRSQKVAREAEQDLDDDTIVGEVIGIAARFDRKLAESYIRRYAEVIEELNASTGKSPARVESSVAGVHLKLALDLIEKDLVLAVSLAERSLSAGINPGTLIFMTKVRKKNAGLANRFFLSALRNVEARGGNDINELFLLYSYAFSTPQVPYLTPQGPALQQIPGYALLVGNGGPTDAELSRTYLRASARILLNSERTQRIILGQVSAGAIGDYYFLKVIEPHVASNLPALTTQLIAREGSLFSSLGPQQRPSVAAIEQRGDLREGSSHSPAGLSELLQRAAETADQQARERLYFQAVMTALNEKKYDVALETVEELSTERRAGLKPFVEYSAARGFIASSQLGKAERLAGTDDDRGRRAYILTLIAKALVKGEPQNLGRASELLNKVEEIAAKLDKLQKVLILTGAASVYADYDVTRASQLLREAIKVGDEVDGFTGDAKLTRSFEFDGFGIFYEMYGEELSLTSVIKRRARQNFNEMLADIRAIKNRLLRLKATIALCQAALAG